MPALPNLSITLLSIPHVIGLMKPSGGAGEYEALIRRIWATSVGSFGIQCPINNPTLGEHLERTVCTGTYCAYEPDPRTPAAWNQS
jgi:hypothetical protein